MFWSLRPRIVSISSLKYTSTSKFVTKKIPELLRSFTRSPTRTRTQIQTRTYIPDIPYPPKSKINIRGCFNVVMQSTLISGLHAVNVLIVNRNDVKTFSCLFFPHSSVCRPQGQIKTFKSWQKLLNAKVYKLLTSVKPGSEFWFPQDYHQRLKVRFWCWFKGIFMVVMIRKVETKIPIWKVWIFMWTTQRLSQIDVIYCSTSVHVRFHVKRLKVVWKNCCYFK